MKKIRITIVILTIIISTAIYTQTIGDFIDVLHLKDGTTIEGIIVEQIPGESVTILTELDLELVYKISEIIKFSKKIAPALYKDQSIFKLNKTPWVDNFKRKEKGHFIDVEFLIGEVIGEFRVTNGYRFGRHAKIGISTGFGLFKVFKNGAKPNFTMNLIYTGEILNKRITPYYEVELGYGIVLGDKYSYDIEAFDNINLEIDNIEYPLNGVRYKNYGGPKVATAIGVKMKTKKKIEYKVSLDYRLSGNFIDQQNVVILERGDIIPYGQNLEGLFTLDGGFGLRFGVGF